LDFIEGLPKSGKFDCILVVVDKFSKFAHFIALAHPFTALKIAQMFLDNIYRLHGMPSAIISDHDRIFTSAFWQALFKLSRTALRMSTSYHPQTDGQTERVNRCLQTSFDALSVLNRDNGASGCLLQNIGTIPHFIRPLVNPHLRCCMAILHTTWVYPLPMQFLFQTCSLGYHRGS
jgi:hypothetical protein